MPASPGSIVARFVAGVAVGVAGGFLFFRGAVFHPDSPAFQCITVGALVSGLLTLVRVDRAGHAVALALGFGLFQLGLVESTSWITAASGLVLASGLFLVALIFDLLARYGMPFGKFLIVGPLTGGVFFAVTPMAQFHGLSVTSATSVLLQHTFLGLVIGETVALGVEVADLLFALSAHSAERLDLKDEPGARRDHGR